MQIGWTSRSCTRFTARSTPTRPPFTPSTLAFPHGAAPEIIEHGANGFLAKDGDEMAELVEEARGIGPERCRRTAAERFSPDRVAAAYESVYRETLGDAGDAGRHLHEVATPAA